MDILVGAIAVFVGYWIAIIIHELGHSFWMKGEKFSFHLPFDASVTGKIENKDTVITHLSGVLFTWLVAFVISLIPLQPATNDFDLMIFIIGLCCFFVTIENPFNDAIVYARSKMAKQVSDLGKVFGDYRYFIGILIIIIVILQLGPFYISPVFEWLATF